jgi:hypothetical protein
VSEDQKGEKVRNPQSGARDPRKYASQQMSRLLVTWLAIAAAFALGATATSLLVVWGIRGEPWLLAIYRDHFRATIGLPTAAMLSFILVVLFGTRFDRIEMEVRGLVKFRGASGPIILWNLSFLSIAAAILVLW